MTSPLFVVALTFDPFVFRRFMRTPISPCLRWWCTLGVWWTVLPSLTWWRPCASSEPSGTTLGGIFYTVHLCACRARVNTIFYFICLAMWCWCRTSARLWWSTRTWAARAMLWRTPMTTRCTSQAAPATSTTLPVRRSLDLGTLVTPLVSTTSFSSPSWTLSTPLPR